MGPVCFITPGPFYIDIITLTESVVRLYKALDIEGIDSEKVLLYAYLNSKFESGFANPIDEAIRNYREFDLSSYRKLDEFPYDFVRKRLSILVAAGHRHLMVTKGAVSNVLAVCSRAERADGTLIQIEDVREKIERQFESLSAAGHRVLGLERCARSWTSNHREAKPARSSRRDSPGRGAGFPVVAAGGGRVHLRRACRYAESTSRTRVQLMSG